MTQKSDTEVTGNTKTVTWRARGYCLTIFDEDELKTFADIECRYKIFGEEICPKTGKKHYQSYIYFENARSFMSLKKLLPTSHIEKARGTPEENRNYCKKDKKFIEKGDPPHQGKKISDLNVKAMTDKEICEEAPVCHRALISAKNIILAEEKFDKMLNEIREDNLKEPNIIWIEGKSGKGKSYAANKMATKNYENRDIGRIQFSNNFANGVRISAKCLWVDEFRDTELKESEFLSFTDKYGCVLNTKGGFIFVRPETIIFSTIQKASEIYYSGENKDHHEQFRRRIKTILQVE